MRTRLSERRLIVLLTAILTLLLAYPYVQGSLLADRLLNLLQAGIVMAAIAVVSTDWKHTAMAALLGCTSLLSGWIPRGDENSFVFVLGAVGGMAFYGVAVVTIVWYVLREKQVSFDTLCGAFCAYMLIGFLWTEVYDLIEYSRPHSIIWMRRPELLAGWADLLYFSFATLTTSGNGEFVPVTAQGRSAALLESVTGVFYMAVMISRLVGLHIASRGNSRSSSS